jgi:PAS domain S-box-containing protein
MPTRRADVTTETTPEELRRETEYLSALHETSLALMHRLDVGDLLETILRRAADLSGTPHGYVYLREPGEEEMQIKVGLGTFERYEGFRLRPGEGLSGKVWETGEPLAISDYDAWSGRSQRFDRDVFHAVVGVPLSSRDEVVGVIGVAYVEPGRTFDDETLRLLTGFGELASIALDNARLYTDVQRELAGRWRVEEELRRAEARYRDLVERLPVTVFIDSLAGVDAPSVYVSPRIERLVGYTPEEWIADPELWARSVHPEDRERVIAAWHQHQTAGEPMVEEYRLKHRDGHEVWVHDESLIVRDAQGRSLFSQGFFLDITERKASEQRVARTVSLLRATLESTADGILVVDSGGRIVTSNRKFAEMWRIPQEVLEARDDDRALASVLDQLVDPDAFLHRVRELYADPQAESFDVLHFKDGRIFERYSQPRRVGGEAVGRVWSFRDVTDAWRAEETLRGALRREHDAAERLRALDEMKNQFLAAVSHELRTPLASVIGFASTLEQAKAAVTEEERQLMLGRLLSNAKKLDRLLSDLLDLDRLARGIVEPNRRATDVADLAGQLAEDADMAGRPLHVEAEAVVANVDPAKVERIVENLLANAVRHTPAGTAVWLKVRREPDGVSILVEDAGPGVPPEEREVIFNAFDRGSKSPGHSPGTGIGLSLVARFAELHGGRAWVEERAGGGSSFRVFLPDGDPS